MTDNIATLEGFTVEVSTDTDFHFLIKRDTDLKSRFRAWDMDEQDWIWVNGWEFSFTFTKEQEE